MMGKSSGRGRWLTPKQSHTTGSLPGPTSRSCTEQRRIQHQQEQQVPAQELRGDFGDNKTACHSL